MRRIISLVIALTVFLSLTVSASATTNDTENYFILSASNSRITNDGNFTISCRNYVRSDRNFKTVSYSIPLTISAQVYSQDPDVEPRNAENVYYTLYLYKVGITDPIGQYTHAANGKTGSTNFHVTTGAEYYFTIVISGSLGGWEYVHANGDLSNIYLV